MNGRVSGRVSPGCLRRVAVLYSACGGGGNVQSNDSRPDVLEIILVLFLAMVVGIALLTVLGPQIETLVFRLTGR